MPDCNACAYLAGSTCTALPKEWPVIPVNLVRACVVAICQEYNRLIAAGMRVLEIGCGTWSPIRQHCQQFGARWEGIDANEFYYGERTIATRIESVEDLSFPDETFDIVVGNQTLEHWNEFGCKPGLGIWQCFRVLKIGGMLLMNVPIHFHGSRIFVEGNLEAIADLFRPYSADLQLNPWRRNSWPLQPVNLRPGYGHTGEEITYTLDVRATRKPGLPPRPKGHVLRWRAWRELTDHKWSFLLWKIMHRLTLLRKG